MPWHLRPVLRSLRTQYAARTHALKARVMKNKFEAYADKRAPHVPTIELETRFLGHAVPSVGSKLEARVFKRGAIVLLMLG